MSKDIRRGLVFAILMQNIGSKSPSYIAEKWNSVNNMDKPEQLLDRNNLETFKKWQRTWGLTFD